METETRYQLLAGKMAKQLRVRGDGLAEVTERAGRKLPRRLRQDAKALIDAEAMSAHPKLSRRVNEKQLARAERRLSHYLEKQNPAAERRGEILDIIAKIAFVFVVVVLSVFFFLLSRGYFD